MYIRIAKIADINAIARLADEIGEDHHAAAPQVFAAPPGLDRDREFWIASINANDGVMLVAEDEASTDIVGFISAAISENSSPPFLNVRKVCRIGTIVVSRDHRSAGIGKQLFKALEGWASGMSAVEIRLEVFAFNRTAIDFYEKLDFGLQSHIMTKALG